MATQGGLSRDPRLISSIAADGSDRRELAVDVGRGTRTRGTVLVTSFR